MKRPVLGSVLAAVVAAPAAAEVRAWACIDGGVFDDPACWTDGLVPGGGDTALLDIDGIYAIAFPPRPMTSERLVLRSGIVGFDLTAPGSTYQLGNLPAAAPSFVVGETGPANAWLEVHVGPGSISSRGVAVGLAAGSLGVLDVLLDAPFDAFGVNGQIEVGAGGIGLLGLDAGGGLLVVTQAHDWVIGRDAGSAGLVELTGGTRDASMGSLVVARGGIGDLRIDGGSGMSMNGGVIGEHPGAHGAVAVTGAGSELSLDGGLVVGLLGHGALTVEGGGLLEVADAIVLGAAQNALGPGVGGLRIAGSGSTGTAGGLLVLGGGGTGTLELAAGGRLAVDGDVTRGMLAANEVILELAGAADYDDVPALSAGGMTDDLDVRVRLAGGYTPAAGDTFVVAAADVSLGTLTYLELPLLPPPLEWIAAQDASEATLLVGPVPGDADGDGDVDVDDLVTVIGAWGRCPVPPAPCPGDLDGSGDVDVNDLVAVVEHWS